MVTLSGAGAAAFMVFVGLFALLTVGLLAGLFIAVLLINKKFEEFAKKADPAVTKLTDTLEQVQRVTMTIGERADTILARGERMTDTVSDNVEKTSYVVRNTVTRPLIELSSLVSGISKGFSTWGHNASHGGKTDHGNNGRA
jgi:hypothetical protein